MSRLLIALLLAAPAAAQVVPAPSPSPTAAPVAQLPRVALQTPAGRIVVEIETTKAPVTAANFLHYVDARRLDGTRFYRVVKVADHYGFVQFGISGVVAKAFAPIRHEPTSKTGMKHVDGTLSMARLAPGTARGDITISVGDQTSFDADPTRAGDNLGYAAFGRVVEGMDVILKIFDAPVDPAKLENGGFRGEVPVAPIRILTARRTPR